MELKSTTSRRTQLYVVDILKLIMSICVIAIHTAPLQNIQGTYLFALYDAVIRQAVPFFFIASGYFLFSRFDLILSTARNISLLKQFLIRFVKLYVTWHMIYLPISCIGLFRAGIPSTWQLRQFLLHYLCVGEQWLSWPLWYLLSTIYAAVFFLILMKLRVKENWIYVISFAVYVGSAALTVWVSNRGAYQGFSAWLAAVVTDTFVNGRIFTGIGCIAAGMYLARRPEHIFHKTSGFAFWGILTLVISILLETGWDVLRSVLLLLAGSALFLWAKSISCNTPPRGASFYRKASSVFYYTHMIWYFLVTSTFRLLGISATGWLLFLLVLFLSSVSAVMIYYLRNHKLIKVLF